MVKYLTAAEIVREKAHGYMYQGKYPQIVVYSCNGNEIDKLVQAFGGHSYSDGNGHHWVLSKRKEVSAFIIKMNPWLPSRHGFEDVLKVSSRLQDPK